MTKKPLLNLTRYANFHSTVFRMYVIVIAPSLLGLLISFSLLKVLIPMFLIITITEVLRAASGKTYTHIWSKLTYLLFKSSHTSYPTKYKPRHSDLLPVIAVSILGSAFFSNDAIADYRLIDSGSYDRAIVEGSLGTSTADLRSGSCSACPLEMALRMIVPEDILLSWADNVKRDQTVRFSGPKQWAYILKDIALEHDLIFILRVQDSMGRNSLSVSKAPVNSGALIYETPRQPEMLTTKTKTWVLEPGMTLPAVLRQWAAKENKRIAWELEREPMIEFEAVFHGNLLDAMENVIAAYQAQGYMREAVIQPTLNGVYVFKSSQKGEF